MKSSLLQTITAYFFVLLLLGGVVGCGGSHSADDHEHGPDTHVHEGAPRAETAIDTTTVDGDHEHGPETHTHDNVPAHE